MTALTLITVEIDRSMPPERKTTVIPTAAINTTAFAPNIDSTLPAARKCGDEQGKPDHQHRNDLQRRIGFKKGQNRLHYSDTLMKKHDAPL